MCVATPINCSSGCNTAGTDCATCPPGQSVCPAGCRDLTRDPMNCGACGTVCASPASGTGIATCVSSSCGIQCNPGYFECSPASLAICQQTVWDFEDASLEGFRVVTTPTAVAKLGITNDPVRSGKYAFGAVIKATGTGLTRGYQVGTPICAGRGPIVGKGITVSGWMLIEPSDPKETFGPASYWGIRITSESGDTLAKGKDINSVKEDLSKADGLFKKSTDAAKLAQVTFADTLTARSAAEKAEASKYASKDWGKGEAELKDAAQQLEEGNLNKAQKMVVDATKYYKSAESTAVNEKAKAAHK